MAEFAARGVRTNVLVCTNTDCASSGAISKGSGAVFVLSGSVGSAITSSAQIAGSWDGFAEWAATCIACELASVGLVLDG